MRIKLTPDKGLRVEKARLNGVPTLILRPAEREPVSIGLMWIHGGGFITGMKEMVYMSRAADLVKQYGVTVYAPGYCLAWQRPYPAAVEDCYRVLEHMSRKGEPVMDGGESAGDGLRCGEVWDILNAFADRLVGLGVYEYAPAGSKSAFMEKLIRFGLAL